MVIVKENRNGLMVSVCYPYGGSLGKSVLSLGGRKRDNQTDCRKYGTCPFVLDGAKQRPCEC